MVDGFPAQRVAVIRNGIDIPDAVEADARPALRARLGLSNDRHYVACVARFHPVKNHAMLLRGFALVCAQQPNVDLLLIGDGPLRGDLEAQADALDIRPHVHFLGIRDDVPGLLAAADVFALTSVSEAASLTLLQAMAAARPVVVTDVGGNGEIVRNGVEGILVPRGDAQAAGAALLDVLRDPDAARGMGRAGRARVAEHYRLDDIVRQYFDAYAAAAERLRRKG
jgi:glycosyltransferase involved in cell wall biosynthesis